MGWSGATGIFDSVVDLLLQASTTELFEGGYPSHSIDVCVEKAYTEIEWDDWDTQDESKYFFPYLRDVMIALGEIDEEE